MSSQARETSAPDSRKRITGSPSRPPHCAYNGLARKIHHQLHVAHIELETEHETETTQVPRHHVNTSGAPDADAVSLRGPRQRDPSADCTSHRDDERSPALIIEIANALRRSDALMATFANAPSEEVTRQYLEAFASAMTIEQAERFVEVTKDKHFEVTGTRDDGQPMVELTEGPPEVDSTSSESCCKCWRARVAFMAWWTAFYSICGGVGAAAGAAFPPAAAGGIIAGCCLGTAIMGTLPNFDDSCT